MGFDLCMQWMNIHSFIHMFHLCCGTFYYIFKRMVFRHKAELKIFNKQEHCHIIATSYMMN